MRQYFVWLWLLIFIIAPASLTPTTAQDPTPKIGVNLAAPVDWSTQWTFVDVFKASRPWIANAEGKDWGQGGTLQLTPEGWVASLEAGQYADTVMIDTPHAQAGEYTIVYEGKGDLQILFLPESAILSREDGRIVVDYAPQFGGLWLRIAATDPANPIRNIHVLMPGFDDPSTAPIFHPLFLERLQPFNTLRFMDFMDTNNPNVAGEWADRPQVTDAWYMEQGVPVEVMVALANELGADAWFNMPHTATDEYVREFATLVRDTLNPDLKVYIEYSNETWNGQFTQAQYVIGQGTTLGLSEDAFQAGLFYHSQRAVEMFGIWEEVFDGTERLVRVLASQSANAWTGEQVITFQNAYEHADALAIAPYFSCLNGDYSENVEQTMQMSVEELLDAEETQIQTCVRQQITANKALTDTYGLELIAYEGGQHLAGIFGAENNDMLTELYIGANRHPRMGELYCEYLTLWDELGGGQFMIFSFVEEPSKWGSWGILEYQDQPIEDAPKYKAITDFIAGNCPRP